VLHTGILLPVCNFFMLIYILIALLFLYAFVQRGTLLHEGLYLPWFWLSALLSPSYPTRTERVYYGSHPRQYYLLCLPVEGEVRQPNLLFYFHGGSWRWGKPEFFKAHAGFFNRLGYAVVLPSYRPCPKHDYRHIREDLQTALRHAHQTAKSKGLPCSSALTGGMSAGGHLAALLALDETITAPLGLPKDWIKGFFALGAPLHLEGMPNSFALRDFAGAREAPMFKAASPYRYAGCRPDLPALVVHGRLDGMVPYRSTAAFARERKNYAPASLTFVKVEKGTHLSVAAWIFRENATRAALSEWLRDRAITASASG